MATVFSVVVIYLIVNNVGYEISDLYMQLEMDRIASQFVIK